MRGGGEKRGAQRKGGTKFAQIWKREKREAELRTGPPGEPTGEEIIMQKMYKY